MEHILDASVTGVTTIPNAPDVTSGQYSITVNCTIHPNSAADQCVVMAMDDGGVIRMGMMCVYNIATYIQ